MAAFLFELTLRMRVVRFARARAKALPKRVRRGATKLARLLRALGGVPLPQVVTSIPQKWGVQSENPAEVPRMSTTEKRSPSAAAHRQSLAPVWRDSASVALPLELDGLIPSFGAGLRTAVPMAMRIDDKARRALMLEQARELASRGHQPLMIEAVLRANGFPEAAEWIDQPHIRKELKNIADAARKQATGLPTEGAD